MWRTGRAFVIVTGLVMSLLVTSGASAQTSTATENLTSVCAVDQSVTPATVTHAGVPAAVAGETVTFTQTVGFEEGTLFQNALQLADGSVSISSYIEFSALPSVLVIDPATIAVTLGGVDLAPTVGTGPIASGWTLETISAPDGRTTWRAYPPGDVPAILAANTGLGVESVVIPAGGQDFVMSYTATVPDVGYAVGDVLDGAECFATVSTGPTNRETDRTVSAVAVVEPDIQLTKTVVGLPVSAADGLVTYRLTVQTPVVNAATDIGVSPSRDVVTVDTVPVGLTPTDLDGNTLGDGDAVPLTGTPTLTGIWDSTARTITTSYGDIDPGVTREYEYRARVDNPIEPGTVLTNTLGATFSSLAGTGAPGDKDFTATPVTADVSIAAAVPEVTKSSNVVKYAPGQPITYTIMATLPAGSSYSNLTLIDTLPDGLTFLAYQTATCSGSPDCPATIDGLATTTNGLGETAIGWYPNNIPASATPVVITVTYTAQIAARYRNNTIVQFLDELTNQVALKWNNVDRFGDVIASTAASADYDGVVDDVNTVIRDHPTVVLDKRGRVPNGGVANTGTYGWNYVDGELVTYTTVFRNTGSQPAANLVIRDEHTQLGVDSSTIQIDGAACPTCTVTEGTGFVDIVWPGPLAVGDSMTLSYVAEPQGTDLRNRITVETYEDLDGSTYVDRPTDAVRIVIPDPVVAISKTLLGGPVSNLEGTVVPFRIRVTNVGSMTARNLTVTDAARFLFDNLPPGQYRTAPVPPDGMVFTLTEQGEDPDADSNGPEATSADLLAGQSDLTLGGGFYAPVSVGGPIWEDANGDGIQQPGEPTFPDVVVNLLNDDGTPYLDVDGDPVTTTTGPDGRFLFDDLPPGQYRTSHGPIPGLVPTRQFVGDDPNLDSNGTDARSRDLASGDADLTLGSGWSRPVTIGGPIWQDLDHNGVIDDGEPPIPGIVIRLLDQDGNPVLDGNGDPITTRTGVDGRFLFENLPPGRYITEPVPPEGFVFTKTGAGDDPAIDSNGPRATSADLLPGGQDLTLGGGFVLPVAVGGPIWEDTDGDGVIDPDESPIPGVVVKLLNKDGTPVLDDDGNPRTTTTGPDGRFVFDGLRPGEYITVPQPPPGFQFTKTGAGDDRDIDSNGPRANSDDVPPGGSDLSLGAGFVRPVTIGGPFWEDLDNDGVIDDGEPPIAGITIRLLDEDGKPVLDGAGTPITTTTGPDGRFLFEGLPPGQYQTSPVPPDGFVWTKQGQGDDRSIDSNGPLATSARLKSGGKDLTLGGGFVRMVTVGGPIWVDMDGDGVVDDDEPPIPGVVVRLLHGDGTPVLDGNGDPVTTTTGPDGRFRFDKLPPGRYRTVPVPPDGYRWTTTGAGDDRTIDSNGPEATSDDLPPGAEDLSLGGGFYRPVTVGGWVWEDIDNSSVKSDSSPPIPGVIVTLLDENGDPVLNADGTPKTTMTDENGRYAFSDLPPGIYYVSIPVPAGFTGSSTIVPTSDQVGSVRDDGGRTTPRLASSGSENLEHNAGFRRIIENELPSTGGDPWGPIRAGVMLLLLGVATLVGTRRRSSRRVSVLWHS